MKLRPLGAPVTQQAMLDVLAPEGLRQHRVVAEVDLAHGEVVGGAPVGVHAAEQIGRKRLGHGGFQATGVSRKARRVGIAPA